jgi:2-polyprenyl-6-methoxyphenol hydroxylase-like FAD-dependent oxidoreductase
MTIQALISGAGPVGLTMALELARFGIPVRIIDKAATRTDKSKAIVIWSRTLELFDRAGLADTLIAAGQKVDAANFIAGDKLIGRVTFDSVHSEYRFALMLPQSDTERLLEEKLLKLGVTIERDVELTSFASHLHGVECTLHHGDGQDETFDCEWLLGCDGAHSTVRHGLDLTFEGNTLLSDWILADLHLSGYPFPESEIATYWHEDGVLVVFPMANDRFRIVADRGLANGPMPVDPTLAQVQEVIAKRGLANATVSNPIWLSAFRINERKVTRYRGGRVFVLGDAAHVHSPAGGQGMNTGMQDAFNLAWKLALVCAGTCSDRILDSYSDERSAVGQMVLENAGRLTEVGVIKSHPLQMVRNIVGQMLLGIAPFRSSMINTMSEVSIGYTNSSLNGPTAHGVHGPKPGERFAPTAGETPIGAGSASRFVLASASAGAASRLAGEFQSLVDGDIRKPPDPDGSWLVRPDGYVACVTKRDDFVPIAAYLRKLGGPGVPLPPSLEMPGGAA